MIYEFVALFMIVLSGVLLYPVVDRFFESLGWW